MAAWRWAGPATPHRTSGRQRSHHAGSLLAHLAGGGPAAAAPPLNRGGWADPVGPRAGVSARALRSLSLLPPTMPWESAPPFIAILAMVGGMAGIQAGVQKLFHGKPKPVGVDAWDRATVRRDERVAGSSGRG